MYTIVRQNKTKLKDKSAIKGISGALRIHQIVNDLWNSDWIKFEQENDDGIDGVIQVRKKGEWTGETIYVQVKSGSGYKVENKKRPNKIGIQLSEKYIFSHRPRWNVLKGAVILIFVDDNNKCYWTDLKNEESYTNENKSIILISKQNRFGSHSKGHFKKISGFFPEDRHVPVIKLSNDNLTFVKLNQPLNKSAREFYKNWRNSPKENRINKSLGEISINRVGWRHISRKQRGFDKIFQSWLLLSAAKRIIQEVNVLYEYRNKNLDGNELILNKFYALRAKVIFPNRHESIVQVVIRGYKKYIKEENSLEEKYWFYSVYEPRRGVNIQ